MKGLEPVMLNTRRNAKMMELFDETFVFLSGCAFMLLKDFVL